MSWTQPRKAKGKDDAKAETEKGKAKKAKGEKIEGQDTGDGKGKGKKTDAKGSDDEKDKGKGGKKGVEDAAGKAGKANGKGKNATEVDADEKWASIRSRPAPEVAPASEKDDPKKSAKQPKDKKAAWAANKRFEVLV